MNITQKNDSNSKCLTIERLTLFYLCLQIALWIYFNLRYPIIYDHDQGKLLYHIIQMWKQKTILIPDWKYVSTLELDCSSWLALPLYAITGNILLSFSISNIIHVILLTAVTISLLLRCNYSKSTAYLAAGVVLTPFSSGWLLYSNMLYIGACQYIVKVILPLWFLEILVHSDHSSHNHWLEHIQRILFLFLLCISIFSSGLYVFICGIAPIIVCNLFYRLHLSKKGLLKDIYFPLLTLAVIAVSYLARKSAGLSAFSEGMTLIKLNDFIPQIGKNFTTLLELFGCLYEKEELQLFSLASFFCIAKLAFVMALIIAGLYSLKKLLYIPATEQNIQVLQQRYVSSSCAFVFLWNLFILQLTAPAARYHLIGVLPLMISAVIVITDWLKQQAFIKRIRGNFLILFFMLFLSACGWKYVNDKTRLYYKDYFDNLQLLADEYDVDMLIILGDSGNFEIGRVYDPDRIYVTYFPDLQSVRNYDDYRIRDDRSALSDRHLLVNPGFDFESELPEYLQSHYLKIGDVYGDSVYYAETCILDGICGPLSGYETIDYPYTVGYDFDESMDADSYFPAGEARIIVSSPNFSCPVPVKTTIYAQASTESDHWGSIEFLIDGNAQVWDLSSRSPSATIEVPENTDFSFLIKADENLRLTVSSIHFDAR